MYFNGKLKELADLRSEQVFTDLHQAALAFDWAKLKTPVNDPAFVNSWVIQFAFNDLMQSIRKPDKHNRVTEGLIKHTTPLLAKVLEIFPDHQLLKAHFVALQPGGEQVAHIDDIFYHKYCNRIAIPLTSNEQAVLMIENTSFSLVPGKIYEMNNRVLHNSKNLGSTLRVTLFADIYDSTADSVLRTWLK